MYRKAALFSILLALSVIFVGSYAHFMPSTMMGTLSMLKLHQHLGTVLMVVVLILTQLSWTQKHCRASAVLLSFGALFFTGLQIALGIWTQKMQSMPALIAGHVLLSLIVLGLLFRLYLRVQPGLVARSISGRLGFFVLLTRGLLFLQIALGAWLSANHGGTACVGFPQCNGAWWPVADYQHAFNIVQGFITSYNGDIAFDAQVAVNHLHRVGALLCFIVLSGVILTATISHYKPIRRAGVLLSVLLCLQIALGVFSLKLAMPQLWVAHTLVAVLLMLPLIAIGFYSRYGFAQTQPDTQVFDVERRKSLDDVVVLRPVEERHIPASEESLYLRLKAQLKKTRSGLGGILANLPIGAKSISGDLLEDIEASLLMADVGMDVTSKIINHLTETLERSQLNDGAALSVALKQELLSILKPCSQPLQIAPKEGPFVILVVGVNGVGKTTTIGKLAKRLQAQGHSVMLAAGDTFRAAAVEQLQVWGERNNIHVVAQHTGADSASVIYDAVQSAQSKGIDVLIADTAGRLHTKANLMEELRKVKRIIGKLDATAPHEVLLVLDAGTGQNALSQARLFNETVELTGLVVTKLDGTAKGGVMFALAKQIGIPIRFIGIGEGIDDLQDFNAENFVNALFVND
jgi:fused signal recognition particle receptor